MLLFAPGYHSPSPQSHEVDLSPKDEKKETPDDTKPDKYSFYIVTSTIFNSSQTKHAD